MVLQAPNGTVAVDVLEFVSCAAARKGKQMFHFYSNPQGTGWLGWIDDADGNAHAFVGLDWRVVFMGDLGR